MILIFKGNAQIYINSCTIVVPSEMVFFIAKIIRLNDLIGFCVFG